MYIIRLLFSSENIMAQFLMKSGGTPKEQARRRTEVCWKELFSFYPQDKKFSLWCYYMLRHQSSIVAMTGICPRGTNCVLSEDDGT